MNRKRDRKKERKKNACGNRSINATCSSALSSENRWSVCSTLTSTKSARIIQRTRASISHLSCRTSYSSRLSFFFFLFRKKRLKTIPSHFFFFFVNIKMSPPIIIDLIYSSMFLLDNKTKEKKTRHRHTERVKEKKKKCIDSQEPSELCRS
jgi:hypothetical protein